MRATLEPEGLVLMSPLCLVLEEHQLQGLSPGQSKPNDGTIDCHDGNDCDMPVLKWLRLCLVIHIPFLAA